MPVWELRTISTDEVIDVVDIYQGMQTVGFEMAKSYFVNSKQLDEKEFDTIFKITPKTPIGGYKWWKEENMRLDDF